jgi:hypothetical protein
MTEIGGQSGTGPVASAPEWYPNFAEHWLFWLAFGLGMLALIFVVAAIRRRVGGHLNTTSQKPVAAIADALDVQPGKKPQREKARPRTEGSR